MVIYIYDISIYRNLSKIGIHRIIDSLMSKYTFLGDKVIYILLFMYYILCIIFFVLGKFYD